MANGQCAPGYFRILDSTLWVRWVCCWFSYLPPERGGGEGLWVFRFSLGFPQNPTLPSFNSIENAPLVSQALITAPGLNFSASTGRVFTRFCEIRTYSGSGLSTSAKKFQVLGPRLCTRILVRAMIGLLKMPLEICQSGERKIRNAFPVIR